MMRVKGYAHFITLGRHDILSLGLTQQYMRVTNSISLHSKHQSILLCLNAALVKRCGIYYLSVKLMQLPFETDCLKMIESGMASLKCDDY